MKKFMYVIVVCCFSLILHAQQITYQLDTNPNQLTTTQANGYDVIELEEATYLEGEEYVGDPRLPVKTIQLILPPGTEPSGVTISVGQQQTLSGTYEVFPTQPPQILDFREPTAFKLPKHTYCMWSSFPNSPIINYQKHQYREYTYINVTVMPFDYNPQTGVLKVLTQLNLSVNYSNSGNIEDTNSKRPNSYYDQKAKIRMQNLVDNPAQVNQFYSPVVAMNSPSGVNFSVNPGSVFQSTDLPSVKGSAVEYVIITNNTDISGNPVGNLVQKFQEFADWKTQKGTPAKVVTLDAIRAAYPGGDVPEKIRNFTKDAYQNWGTEYILLGGTGNIIPVRWYYTDIMPTDLYYADIVPLTNNWNSNGDENFGDGADFTADLAIGRAPVDTEVEAETFLQKNFTYSRNNLVSTIPSGNWLGKTLLGYGACFDRRPPEYAIPTTWTKTGLSVGYNIVQAHHAHTNIHTMFEFVPDRNLANPPNGIDSWCKAYYPLHNSTCTDNGIDIMDEDQSHAGFMAKINEKPGLINVLDHGGPHRIGLGKVTHLGGLIASDFEGLPDTGKYPVFLSGGCHTVTIERNSYIGERWVNSPGGGVAFYGASADIYATPSYNFNREFYNQLFAGSDSEYKLGYLHRATANHLGSTYLNRIMQLLGDPDLSIYTQVPVTMSVSHPNSMATGNQNLSVAISDFPSGEEVLVSVYKEGEVLASTYSTTSPVSFNITPDTVGQLEVTATAHNAEPYQGTIQVTPSPNTHLYISDLQFTDENNNATIEPGEEIDLLIELSNSGNTTATGITGELVLGANETSTITQHTSSFNDIAFTQSETATIAYTFTAATGETLRGVAFELQLTTDQGDFAEPILLTTKSHDLQTGDRSVTVNNMETNIFSIGDQVAISLLVKNQGLITAEGVTGSLSTNLSVSLASVNSNSPTANFGDISPQGSANNNTEVFLVDIGNSYAGQALPFTLTLTDAFGNTKDFEIDLAEDNPPLISGFDYTSSSNYIKPFWDPVANIQGYNVYRSDQQNGSYVKINDFLLTTASVYEDLSVQSLSEYWYKISVVSITGNERSLEDLIPYPARTKLARHEGFPIAADDEAARGVHSSPTVFDVDGDGTKEIFMAYRNSVANDGIKGRMMAFYENGQELFDIDGNATEVWGFAGVEEELYPLPAVGDLENDGQAEVVAIGRDHTINRGVLYGFRTVDNNNDQFPDKLWNDGEISVGHKVYRNPVLADLDDDGYLEIIILDEHQRIVIYDKDGNILKEVQVGNKDWSEGQLAVADIDNDNYKEIVFGVHTNDNNKGALYKLNIDNCLHYSDCSVAPELVKEFSTSERADSGVVLADIDNDNEFEAIIITKEDSVGRIYALNLDNGTFVNSNWNGAKTLSINTNEYGDIPRIAVGDLNHDGSLEIVYGDTHHLYVLDNSGNDFPNFPVDINAYSTLSSCPILADIDPDDDIEIIINEMRNHNSNISGTLKAYNVDGTNCSGWDLVPDSESAFVSSPYVGDIDNDQLSEVVISSDDNVLYVWDTEGDGDKVEWGSYRANAQNTAVYGSADCLNSNGTLDLVVKNSEEDITEEYQLWHSKDIWVRNQPDGKTNHEHQNPEYSATTSNYVYVRISNKSCVHSSPGDILKLYWAKANATLTWPTHWNGNYFEQGVQMGGLVDEISIPILAPGEEIILEFPWAIPNPYDYNALVDSSEIGKWHFCLLARVVSEEDPMTFTETSFITDNVRYNNNIGWKNTTVVDLQTGRGIGGGFGLSNPFRNTRPFDLVFYAPDHERKDRVFEEAEISVKMDTKIFEGWKLGGQEMKGFRETKQERIKLISGAEARFRNIILKPNEFGAIHVNFNFLTEKVTDKKNFKYVAALIDQKTGKIIGGEAFDINREGRDLFYAEAASSYDENENKYLLTANDIGESAQYNWYDSEGNFIASGEELVVEEENLETYELEVIANFDGYKDYKNVEIQPSQINKIISISPNPANSYFNINYDISSNVQEAYLQITHSVTGAYNNYIIELSSESQTININNYTTGVYIVSLICDGEIVDYKNLIVE